MIWDCATEEARCCAPLHRGTANLIEIFCLINSIRKHQMTAAMKRDYPIQPRKDIMSPQSFNSVPPNPSGPIPPPVHLYYPYGCYPQVHPAGPLPLMNHGTSPGMGSNDIQLARHPHGSLLPQQTSPYSVAGGPDPTQEKRNAKTAASKSQPSSPERLHSTPYRGDSGSAKSSRNTPVDNNIQSRDGPSNWRPGHSPYSYPQQHLPPYCAEAQWGNIRDHPPPHHPRGPPPPYHHWAGAPHPPPLPHGMYGGLPSHPPPHLPPQMHSRDGRSAYWPNHPVSNRSTGGPLDPAGTGGPGARGPVASAVVHRKDKLMPQNPTSSLQVGPPVTSSDAFTNEVDGREGATSPTQIEIHHRDEVENMGCTCKKTNCLKLYCQCFGIRIYCGANCRCKDCFNDSKHEKERKEAMRNIISRNPSAFDTKFKKTGQPVAVASSEIPPEKSRVLAHKLGCKCRKSNCMKKVRKSTHMLCTNFVHVPDFHTFFLFAIIQVL